MAAAVCVASILAWGADHAGAQELEPGAYAIAPVGVNVIVLSNTFSKGDLAFDPAGPIDDASAAINATTIAYARTVNVLGRSGQVAFGWPIVAGHVEGRYLGEQAEVTRFGPGDPRLRVAVNLYGAPVMGLKTFSKFRPKRTLGASVTISMPFGNYSSERLINVGGGRWAFKPELGFVQYFGRWAIETFGGIWLFSKNERHYRGSVRTQDPIASFQFHVDYRISPRFMVTGNANYYRGGQTTVNDLENADLQRNSRAGLTLTQSLAGGRTLRVAISQGAVTSIGADFTSVSLSFQRLWGGRME